VRWSGAFKVLGTPLSYLNDKVSLKVSIFVLITENAEKYFRNLKIPISKRQRVAIEADLISTGPRLRIIKTLRILQHDNYVT
jgi:hypothetical protein